MPDERLQDASKSSGIVILGEDGSVGTGSEIFAENLKRQLDQELTRLSVDAKNKDYFPILIFDCLLISFMNIS